MHDFENDNGCTVTYDSVRKAMDDEPFTMSLTDSDEISAVIEVVNQGIDSHLEACFCPDFGDRYEGGERKAGKLVLCRSLDCVAQPRILARPAASAVRVGRRIGHQTRQRHPDRAGNQRIREVRGSRGGGDGVKESNNALHLPSRHLVRFLRQGDSQAASTGRQCTG